jgi:myo-inositol-1-phosphate synthase
MARLAVVGIGNCACALLQAIDGFHKGEVAHVGLSGVEGLVPAEELEVVAAFDIDTRKVGRPVHEAIFAPPNCTSRYREIADLDVVVSAGLVADGAQGPLNATIQVAPECEQIKLDDLVKALKASAAQLVVIYLPVGAQRAAEAYAEAALRAGCGLVNNTPALLACSPEWQARFAAAGLPLIGDDMKSHIGSTTLHQALLALLAKRQVNVDNTYQLNIGGNTDFLNMRDIGRSADKRRTKSTSLAGFLGDQSSVGIGPSDYIPHLRDNKIGYIHIEGTGFLGMPYSIELRLKVEDSPNSAAVAAEACRLAASLAQGKDVDVRLAASELFKSPWTSFL